MSDLDAAPERIALDTGPLAMLGNPNPAAPGRVELAAWVEQHLAAGTQIYLPEIGDYEACGSAGERRSKWNAFNSRLG